MALANALRRGISTESPQTRLALRASITLAACVIALLIPQFLGDYAMSVAVTVVTYAILGLGLNVVVGYAGLLDLGYAAFFAIGAYTSALLELHFSLSFWEALPIAIVAAAVAGCIIGYPTLRLRSDYLAIVTLGFGEIVRITVTNLNVTGGPNGLYGIPPAGVFGHSIVSTNGLYYLGLFFMVLAIAFTGLLSRSRLGRAWRSLREDETASEAVGVPAIKVKLMAYVMGAIVGAIAGMLFAARFGTIDPTSFTYNTSVMILIVVIVGGMGSIPGMLLGAIIVIALPELLRSVSNYRMLFFALALVALMLVRPEGLLPPRRTRRGAYRAQPPPDEAPSSPAPAGRRRPGRGELLLQVTDVSHRFGGVRAVDGVSFDVHAGEIVSVIGPNGAGKTTVFNCITGLVTPRSGDVRLGGTRSLRGVKPHKVVRLGLARTFQGIRLFDGLDAVENCLVGLIAHQSRMLSLGGLLSRTTREDRARAMYWLDFVGLADRGHLLASELSYGERRRLEIARALMSEPQLLLLDEPAAGTNPTEKRELMSLVKQVRDTGVAVVLIEHDMGLVMELSDRVIVLDQGRIIAAGEPQQVRDDPRVIDAYLGREEDDDPDAGKSVEEVLGWRS
ncbi:MAG TPA: ATP-binding cassette domain-containing protein [Jatrophihabitans sp.]|nr:ATP-binding cassette domain-containing protein [Jatrophihabitans sp.]